MAVWEHLRHEVPGRVGLTWKGSPMHRCHTIQVFLANSASPRPHLMRLPAYAPDINPDEGFWQQLKGVEWLCNGVCQFTWRVPTSTHASTRARPRASNACSSRRTVCGARRKVLAILDSYCLSALASQIRQRRTMKAAELRSSPLGAARSSSVTWRI